jgi:hypothetical protein
MGHIGWPAWPGAGQLGHGEQRADRLSGGGSGQQGRGRGPGGPGLTLELDGEVGWAGGRPVVADFGGRDSGPARRIDDVGGVSRGSGLIRRAGRRRRRWRIFPASRRGRGRRGAARLATA